MAAQLPPDSRSISGQSPPPMAGDEANLIARGAGKWGDPDFPKTDWIFDHAQDLGEPDATCEMCEYKMIRFVHHLRHPGGLRLKTGCVCAGHLLRDIEAAEALDREMKNADRRLANSVKALARYRKELKQLGALPASLKKLEAIRDRTLAIERQARNDKRFSRLHNNLELGAALLAEQADNAVKRILIDMEGLERALACAEWTPTKLGCRFVTSFSDEVVVMEERDGCRVGIRCKGERGRTWEDRIFESIGAAKKKGIDILRSKLRKAGRLSH